jgi:smad nuclear-interacting protein 1
MGRNRDKSHKSDKDLREDHKKSSKSKEKQKNYSLQELKIRARNEEFDKIKDNYNKYGNKRHSEDRNDYRRHGRSDEKYIKEEQLSDNEHKRQKRTKFDKNIDKSEEFWSKESKEKTNDKVVEKAKPNFETTGKLCEDTNTFNGVVIKYNEPSEARKPKRKWRLYPFKGEESLPFIPIHRQSAYLLGRDRKVADIPIDHPSCSKQHSVLQFRLVEYQREDSTTGKRVRPYILDLESSNGTFVNNQRIEPKRYYELFEKDVIKFGFSTREYVVLHEESKDENEDDDIQLNDEQKDVKNDDISK